MSTRWLPQWNNSAPGWSGPLRPDASRRQPRRGRSLPIPPTTSRRCAPRRPKRPEPPAGSVDTLPGAVRPTPPRGAAAGPRGANLLNPEISATGDVRLVARTRGRSTNAVAHEFEFAFQSALDPYSSTKIFMTFEEEEVGIEEGYIYWTGLPGPAPARPGQVPPAGGRPQPLASARPARDRVPAGLPALLRRGRPGRCRSLALHRAAVLARRRATHEVWLQGTTRRERSALGGGRSPFLWAAAELLAAEPEHVRPGRHHRTAATTTTPTPEPDR